MDNSTIFSLLGIFIGVYIGQRLAKPKPVDPKPKPKDNVIRWPKL